MTIILLKTKTGEKLEIDESTPVEQVAMDLGVGSVQAQRAKFFAPGSREIKDVSGENTIIKCRFISSVVAHSRSRA